MKTIFVNSFDDGRMFSSEDRIGNDILFVSIFTNQCL